MDTFLRLPSLFCLGVLLVLAGCTAGPFGGQEGPVTVTVNNLANVTYTFEVSVVKVPANVTTRRDDGLTGNYRIGQGGRTYSPDENHTWTAVELPESARLRGRYTLKPGEQNRSSIDEFPTDFAVIVVIYQDENEIVEWVSDHCDGDLGFVEITMFDYGSSTASNCEGGLF